LPEYLKERFDRALLKLPGSAAAFYGKGCGLPPSRRFD
jgi:hypothetical protein